MRDGLTHEVGQSIRKNLLYGVLTYLGQLIAIYQGEVVDSDTDIDELIIRIEDNYPHQTVLIELVEEQLPGIINVRSPRFVD